MEKLKVIEQVHRCLPQTLTKEKLAQLITEKQKQVIPHLDKRTFDPEEIAEFEHKSSLASRSIDELDEVKEQFMHRLKKGTDPDPKDPTKFQPFDITIPPTKGIDALKANREFADGEIKRGYEECVTDVYMIPFPEEELMVAVTIEGYEAPKYTRKMRPEELATDGNLFRKETQLLEETSGAADIKTTKRKGGKREAVI